MNYCYVKDNSLTINRCKSQCCIPTDTFFTKSHVSEVSCPPGCPADTHRLPYFLRLIILKTFFTEINIDPLKSY